MKDKTQVRTYRGRRAEVSIEYLSSDQLGERVVTMKWLDDATESNGGYKAGTVVVQRIYGDGTGRKKNRPFRSIETTVNGVRQEG